MNREQCIPKAVLMISLFVLLGALLPFLGCGKADRQFGDLRLVATPQALQGMELSPLFKQAASVPESNIQRLSTVQLDGRRVVRLWGWGGRLGRLKLEAMSIQEVEMSARFRLRDRESNHPSMGFFISIDSGYLAIMLRWIHSDSGEVNTGLVVESVPAQGDESKTLSFFPLELAQDEWIELGIRSEVGAVVATIAGQDFRTLVEGLTENTPVDVGLALSDAISVVDQVMVGGQEITPRQFASMFRLHSLKHIALRGINPDFQLGGNPLAVTKVWLGRENRDMLTAVPRSLFEFAVDVDQRTELAFAMGCRGRTRKTGDGSLTKFTVQVVDSRGEVHEVFATAPGDTAHYGAWKDHTVDLSSFQNSRITLRFITEIPAGADQEDWDEAFWGDPRLRLPDPPPVSQPNVVLISLDALRPDHLGCYGYARPTSPFMDSVAAGGVVFDHAFSHAPWTTPSHMSTLTGMQVGFHGVVDSKVIAPPALWTLAESYAAAGYRTAGFTGNAAFWGSLGFFQGFQRYLDGFYRGDDTGDWTAQIMEKTLRWLSEEADQPFFLFFHTYEPHSPYTHTYFLPDSLASLVIEPGTRHKEAGIARYDSGILFVDGYMRKLWAALEETGALPRTIIALTSDHGQELFDRSDQLRGHTHSLHRDVLQALFILSGPGVPEAVHVPEVVGLADVAPTLLELCDLPIPESMRGRSLVPLMHGKRVSPRPVFSVLGRTDLTEPKSIIYKEHHLILHMDKFKDYIMDEVDKNGRLMDKWKDYKREDPVQLYDYIADPNEMRNLAKEHPTKVVELNRLLNKHRQEVEAAKVQVRKRGGKIDEETLRQLRALGYVQ